MSHVVTVLLIVAYVALTAICAVEKRWPVCLYWVGAAIVTGGVLWMSTRMEISK